MFDAKIAVTINTLVDDVLRADQIVHGENKVMFVTVKTTVAKDRDSEPALRRFVHLMYHVQGRTVLVGSQVSDMSSIPAPKVWERQSYHDSCWRSDGTDHVINGVYFQMCKEAFPDMAPVAVYSKAELMPIRFREVTAVDQHAEDGAIRLTFA